MKKLFLAVVVLLISMAFVASCTDDTAEDTIYQDIDSPDKTTPPPGGGN
jgi:hypothetical protein